MIKENGQESLLFAYTDHLGSLVALTDYAGNVLERHAYDPWGNRRSAYDWTREDDQPARLNRGFTMHEHLDAFNIINMNGRVYDPITSQFLSPDPYVQAPGMWLNYNRYGYCLNNPLMFTDPSGESVILASIIIGAVMGGVSGYIMGDMNGAKGWGMVGYIAGGAAIGAASGYFGASIAAGGGFMANTMGIIGASAMNSVGTAIMTDGQNLGSVSFGAASFDLNSGTFGFLGKKGNKWYENLGYGLGALANLADINQLINSTPAILYTDDSDIVSHNAVVEKNVPINYKTGEGILMSFGPNDTKVPENLFGYATYFRKSTSYYTVYEKLSVDMTVNKYIFTATRGLGKILPFQGITTNCVNMASLSLWLNGIPNIGLHPYFLHATTWAYSVGIRPDSFSYYLTNQYKR